MMTRLILANLIHAALFLASGAVVAETPPFEVRSYLDTERIGWAYPKHDHVVAVETADCAIEWHLAEATDDNWYLIVRSECSLGFDERLPILRAILEEVAKVRPLDRFKTLGWPGFAGVPELQIPIAVASATSPDYQDYLRRDPTSRRRSINSIYLDLVMQTDAYHAWQQLFRDFGAQIELTSVEKVFAARAEQLPFQAALTEQGIATDQQVIYEAGLCDFSLSAIDSP